MIIHETFVRCPICDYNQFEEKKLVILDKETYEKTGLPSKQEERIEYICHQCGKLFIEHVKIFS